MGERDLPTPELTVVRKQKVFIPRLGIEINPLFEAECDKSISNNGNGTLNPLEFGKLWMMILNPRLASKILTPEDAEDFMSNLDPSWQRKLLNRARFLKSAILQAQIDCGIDASLSIVLSGPVALGTVTKPTYDNDPAFKLSVYGSVEDDARNRLLSAIKPKVQQTEMGLKSLSQRLYRTPRTTRFSQIEFASVGSLRENEFCRAVSVLQDGGVSLHDGPLKSWKRNSTQAVLNFLRKNPPKL